MPLSDSAALHCVKTAETGEFPSRRITGPSSGNARKLAGLRCGPVMRWPPMLVWPLVGQANSSLLPSLLSLPVQKPEQRDPAPRDTMAFPRRRESGQVLLITGLVFVFVLFGLIAVVGDLLTLSNAAATARDAAFLGAQAGGSDVDIASAASTDVPTSGTLTLEFGEGVMATPFKRPVPVTIEEVPDDLEASWSCCLRRRHRAGRPQAAH